VVQLVQCGASFKQNKTGWRKTANWLAIPQKGLCQNNGEIIKNIYKIWINFILANGRYPNQAKKK
jgi:hypothetical protein